MPKMDKIPKLDQIPKMEQNFKNRSDSIQLIFGNFQISQKTSAFDRIKKSLKSGQNVRQ